MEKQQLAAGLIKHLDRNYEDIKGYYERKPAILKELILLTFEINRCFIVGTNMAAITLTNHLLEWLLKITLIADERKFLPLEHPIDTNLELIHSKYTDWDLEKTINACCRKSLISKEQKKQLLVFKEKFRNGFSHASSNKILKEEESIYKRNDIMFLLRMSTEGQAQEVYFFSKKNALKYYDYVFNLIFTIEDNLTLKYNLT